MSKGENQPASTAVRVAVIGGIFGLLIAITNGWFDSKPTGAPGEQSPPVVINVQEEKEDRAVVPKQENAFTPSRQKFLSVKKTPLPERVSTEQLLMEIDNLITSSRVVLSDLQNVTAYESWRRDCIAFFKRDSIKVLLAFADEFTQNVPEIEDNRWQLVEKAAKTGLKILTDSRLRIRLSKNKSSL